MYLKSVFAVPPQLTMPSVQKSYNEDSLVNLSCTASGTPDPVVTWMVNDIVKSSGNKTAFLVFNNISRQDAGQYTCKANNQAGEDEHHVTIEVHCKYTKLTFVF